MPATAAEPDAAGVGQGPGQAAFFQGNNNRDGELQLQTPGP